MLAIVSVLSTKGVRSSGGGSTVRTPLWNSINSTGYSTSITFPAGTMENTTTNTTPTSTYIISSRGES